MGTSKKATKKSVKKSAKRRPAKKAHGRPSGYSDKLAAELCRRIAEGESLNMMTKEPGMPTQGMVYRWLDSNERFREMYQAAKVQQQDYYVQQMVDIADTTDDPAKARLQIDARKWHAAKLAPRKYGDRIDVEANVQHQGTIRIVVGGSATVIDA